MCHVSEQVHVSVLCISDELLDMHLCLGPLCAYFNFNPADLLIAFPLMYDKGKLVM